MKINNYFGNQLENNVISISIFIGKRYYDEQAKPLQKY